MKRNQRTFNVYVAVNRSSALTRDWIRGVLDFAKGKTNWSVRIVQPEEGRNGRLSLDFERGCVDAVIGCFLSPKFIRIQLNAARSAQAPVVLFPAQKGEGVASVDLDVRGIAEVAEKGAKRRRCVTIGYVGSRREGESELSERIARACAERAETDRIGFSAFSNKDEDWLSGLRVWLEALPKPCCVVAFSDRLAMDVANVCRFMLGRKELGRSVWVLGIGNDELICQGFTPKLTSIALRSVESGAAAARIVDKVLKDGSGVREGIGYVCGVRIVEERETLSKCIPAAELVKQACDYIRKNACSRSKFNQFDVARHLRCSVRTIQLAFAEARSETTILKEIHKVRLEKVCRLLKTSKKPITKITFESGFGSLSRLKDMFAKQFGQTMRDYRNAHSRQAVRLLQAQEREAGVD